MISKAIATTVNDPSAKMRGLSIGIFPGFGGTMACAQRPQDLFSWAAIPRLRDLCGEIGRAGLFWPDRFRRDKGLVQNAPAVMQDGAPTAPALPSRAAPCAALPGRAR